MARAEKIDDKTLKIHLSLEDAVARCKKRRAVSTNTRPKS